MSLQSAIDHLSRGAAREALAAASEACHVAPAMPEAHYIYGQAWLAMNEPARAEQAFAAAIQLRPGWAEPWVNYGVARYRQGAIEDAKIAMQRALAAEPGHAAAAANLGVFLRLTGEADAAEKLLHAAIAREPHNAGARLNLAADLLQEERPAEALALLDAVAPPEGDPRAACHWHLQRAMALLQTGQHAAARQTLDALAARGTVPPDLAPLWRWRLLLLALGARNVVGACAEAGLMEDALKTMGPEAVLEHQIMAHFDLAKFWSSQGGHGKAFAHWTAGHDLLKHSQPFSRARHKKFIDASIAAFSRERLDEGPCAQNTDRAPVLIVGMPRSGTTLCEQILAAHKQVHGAGERAALGNLFQTLGDETPEGVARIAGLGQPALDSAANAFLADLHALAPDKTRIVDKMPGNYRYLGLVGLLLQGAKIIHCVRDPRDIGLSIFTFRFYGDHGYAHDLGDLGFAIGQQERLMDHWKAVLPGKILTVKLSDWVADFEGTLARVLTHLDLPPDPNCARFHQADNRVRTVSRAQVRQPVNARGLGRWKTYANELAPLIEELERAGCLMAWRDNSVEAAPRPG